MQNKNQRRACFPVPLCFIYATVYVARSIELVTPTREVMLSSALVCEFVFLSVYQQDYPKIFNRFSRNSVKKKGGTWTTEEIVRFSW